MTWAMINLFGFGLAFAAQATAVMRTGRSMKFIQTIDGAENCVYDIFVASDDDFALLFPNGTDIAFSEDFDEADSMVTDALNRLWANRIPKAQAIGIHGTYFCGLPNKRQYYPTLKDEEAVNPDGTRLR